MTAAALFLRVRALNHSADIGKRHYVPFCPLGRRWARRQKSLKDAWQTCQRGSWMAWWLNDFMRVPTLAIQKAVNEVGYTGVFTYVPLTGSSDVEFANAIRRAFTYTGKRRVTRGLTA